MFTAAVAAAGYLPVPLTGEDYIELLPAVWRSINDYGVRNDNRTYDAAGLGKYRRQSSGVIARRGLWQVHHDPYDLSTVWVRDHRAGGWITANWRHARMIGQPFTDVLWRQARRQVAATGADDSNETAVAAALDELFRRANRSTTRTCSAGPIACRHVHADAPGIDRPSTTGGVRRGRRAARCRPDRTPGRVRPRGGLPLTPAAPLAETGSLTTKEGWATFVDTVTEQAQLLSRTELAALNEPDRAVYDDTRREHHVRMVVVKTPAVRQIIHLGRQLTVLNRHQVGARRGLIVTGRSGTGKSTAITQLGRAHENLCRRRSPATRLTSCRSSTSPSLRQPHPRCSPLSLPSSSACLCPPA